MAQQHHQQQQEEDQQSNNHLSLLDSFYCEEEKWEECEEEDEINEEIETTNPCLLPLMLLEQDLFWEDEELISLFSKEQDTHALGNNSLVIDASLAMARRLAVEWILRVNAHYGFSAVTALLAVNYLDRFISKFELQKDKPWMGQLAAVACLSLAAKVEETQVPLLLGLQVGETKYVFEAKTIQRMELLVLSTLDWKMNPVTPLSFLDHIIRRLGLKNHLHWEFLRRSESLLLSVIADSKFALYLPSVLATAAMLLVINEVEPCNPMEYQNQLMGVLKISKAKVDECYKHLLESSLVVDHGRVKSHKRKFSFTPSSPNGVINASFSCDSSNDSWAVGSPVPVVFKKSRAKDQQMRLPSFNRVLCVDVLTSPR